MKSAIPAQWEEFLQALPGIDVGNEQQECILLLFSGGPPTEAGVPANRCHAISIDDARNMVMQFLHSLNQMGDPVGQLHAFVSSSTRISFAAQRAQICRPCQSAELDGITPP